MTFKWLKTIVIIISHDICRSRIGVAQLGHSSLGSIKLLLYNSVWGLGYLKGFYIYKSDNWDGKTWTAQSWNNWNSSGISFSPCDLAIMVRVARILIFRIRSSKVCVLRESQVEFILLSIAHLPPHSVDQNIIHFIEVWEEGTSHLSGGCCRFLVFLLVV